MGLRDYKEILTELKVQNWDVEQIASGHFKAVPPDQSRELVHFSTSNDPRAFHNTLRTLKKQGFTWPPLSKTEKRSRSAKVLLEETEPVLETPEVLVPETKESIDMDKLFAELKEAKSYLLLTEENLTEAQRKLDEAKRAYDEALGEKTKAAWDLKNKKEKFDQYFDTAAA